MPTYTYKCPVHGEFDVEQKITDTKLERCTRLVGLGPGIRGVRHCGEALERLISGGTGFHLKGSGWAKDGYK